MGKVRRSFFLYSVAVPSLVVGSLHFSDSINRGSASLEMKELTISASGSAKDTGDRGSDLISLDDLTGTEISTPDQIRAEWDHWVGTSSGLTWEDLPLKNRRLSMILSKMRMTDATNSQKAPFEFLHLHSIGSEGQADSFTSLYTAKLDGPDEANLSSELLVSHKIEVQGGRLDFSKAQENMYQLRLAPRDENQKPFELLAPVVNLDLFQEVSEDSVNIVRSLIFGGSGFSEQGLYHKEIETPHGFVEAQLTLRKTEFGTLSLEIQLQNPNTPHSSHFALIYD